MIKNNKKNKKNFDERIAETTYNVIVGALQSVLNTDIKKTGSDGKEITDCGMTVSAMRLKARLALEFVNELDGKVDKMAKK